MGRGAILQTAKDTDSDYGESGTNPNPTSCLSCTIQVQQTATMTTQPLGVASITRNGGDMAVCTWATSFHTEQQTTRN